MILSLAGRLHILHLAQASWLGLTTTTGMALLLCIAQFGCARNPVTGRPEPVLTTERAEIEQGNEWAKQVEEEFGMVDDPKLANYIDQLGQKLAIHSPRKNLTYRFYVVDTPEPNAFALPGGHIYVSRGLLTLPNSEDELAAIIGHEIGHVAARHSVRRQTASAPLIPIQLATAIGGAATAIVSPRLGQIVSGAGQWPGAFALAAYSREQEREADELGQQIASAAGFDPSALASLMHTLALEESLNPSEPARSSYMRSHPPSPERSLDAQKYARTLVRTANESPPISRRAFLEKMAGVVVGENARAGVFVGNRFLHPELGIGFDLPDGWRTSNTPDAVSARQVNGNAQILVEIVSQGDDPLASALAFNQHVRLDTGPSGMLISGLSAAQATAQLGGRGDRRTLLLTWIAYDGLIYRIAGATEPRNFEPMSPVLDQTPQSFHILTEEQLQSITENRLRIVVAEPSERLGDLNRRSRNAWTVEQTAIFNALDPDKAIGPGRRVKIAHSERYEPERRPLPESPSD